MAGKQYNFDGITPEMKGTLAFWSERIGMGRANLRTAIKKGTLDATLEAGNPEKPDLKAWHVSGAQILAWRESVGTRSTGGGAAGPKTRKYKIADALTVEQAEEAKAYLAKFAGDFKLDLVLVSQRKAKPAAEAGKAAPVVTAEAPKARRAFGNRS